MIETRELFELHLHVPQIAELGATPYGRRRVATVAGGRFEGSRLRGSVAAAPGGDWMLLRADDVFELDVRITLLTDDGASILMSYRGLRHGPPEVMAALGRGEVVDPARYYFRIAPVFETAAPAYAWLNRMVAVGTGRRDPGGPVYRVFEVL